MQIIKFYVYGYRHMIGNDLTITELGMNPWAKFITNFFPITLPSESIRSIVSRGWGNAYTS